MSASFLCCFLPGSEKKPYPILCERLRGWRELRAIMSKKHRRARRAARRQIARLPCAVRPNNVYGLTTAALKPRLRFKSCPGRGRPWKRHCSFIDHQPTAVAPSFSLPPTGKHIYRLVQMNLTRRMEVFCLLDVNITTIIFTMLPP